MESITRRKTPRRMRASNDPEVQETNSRTEHTGAMELDYSQSSRMSQTSHTGGIVPTYTSPNESKKRFTEIDIPMPGIGGRVLLIETIVHKVDNSIQVVYYEIPTSSITKDDWTRMVTMHGVYDTSWNEAEYDYDQEDWDVIKAAAGTGSDELFSMWLENKFSQFKVSLLQDRTPIRMFDQMLEFGYTWC